MQSVLFSKVQEGLQGLRSMANQVSTEYERRKVKLEKMEARLREIEMDILKYGRWKDIIGNDDLFIRPTVLINQAAKKQLLEEIRQNPEYETDMIDTAIGMEQNLEKFVKEM